MSHPSRGAWIEIGLLILNMHLQNRRTPRGVRGLKYPWSYKHAGKHRRTPRGVRGLK